MTLAIYFTTEVYYAYFKPYDEINLSLLWCIVILFYAFITLSKITFNYIYSDEGALCVIFAGLSFIASLLIQLGDTKIFDLNLKSAYVNLTTNFNTLIANISNQTSTFNHNQQFKQPIEVDLDQTKQNLARFNTYSSNELMYSCLIALFSSYIGSLLAFPSLRLAKLHLLSIKYASDSLFKRVFLYINFFLPLIISICWFKVNIQEIIVKSTPTGEPFIGPLNVNEVSSEEDKVAFNKLNQQFYRNFLFIFKSSTLKLVLIITFVLMRLILYRHYAQSYLNIAYEQAAIIRKKTTKLTNVQYQSTIISIYKYYGVVANQYMIPIFMILFLALLMKTLGDLQWCDLNVCENLNNKIVSFLQYYSIVSNGTLDASGAQQNSRPSMQIFKNLESNAFNITSSYVSFKSVFTSFVLRSLIGYLTFWTCLSSFLISCIGLMYYQYMDRSVVNE